MTPTNETGWDGTGWAVLAAAGAIVVAFLKKVDPRLALAWLNEPTMRPLHAKVDRICRVVDNLPGADEAHAKVMAEDERLKKRWEP